MTSEPRKVALYARQSKADPDGIDRQLPRIRELANDIASAQSLADGLVNPSLLVALHRDIDKLHGLDERRLGSSSKQYALRWAIFEMSYSALEAFFNDILREPGSTRTIPLNADKLRNAGSKQGVRLFTNDRECEPAPCGSRPLMAAPDG